MIGVNKITQLIKDNNKRLDELKKIQKQTYDQYHKSIKQIANSNLSTKDKEKLYIKLVIMYEKQMSKIHDLIEKYVNITV